MSPEHRHGTPINILLVEDSLPDIELTQRALQDGKLANRIFVVRDGEEALRWLRKEAPFADTPHPQLVLLDLNLPKIDGREVLSAIRQDPKLRLLPVVVLTTSRSDEDILKSYQLNANCYITKPVQVKQFLEVVQSIRDFWLTVVSLPPET